jgi:hypothetical protein
VLGKRDDPLDLLWVKYYFQKLWGGKPEEHQSVVKGWLGPWIDGGTGTYTQPNPNPRPSTDSDFDWNYWAPRQQPNPGPSNPGPLNPRLSNELDWDRILMAAQ